MASDVPQCTWLPALGTVGRQTFGCRFGVGKSGKKVILVVGGSFQLYYTIPLNHITDLMGKLEGLKESECEEEVDREGKIVFCLIHGKVTFVFPDQIEISEISRDQLMDVLKQIQGKGKKTLGRRVRTEENSDNGLPGSLQSRGFFRPGISR